MIKNNYGILFLFFALFNYGFSFADFSKEWENMQKEYRNLIDSLPSITLNEYMHSHWIEQTKKLSRIIFESPDKSFLQRAPIAGSMVRSSFGETQKFELMALNYCVSDKTKKLLSKFKDVSFGGVQISINEFNCSINSLGQLFYLSKILEISDSDNLNRFVELGGGYGCLARMVKQVLPDCTYIIIDLPEYLAIQNLFLKSTLEDVQIIVHKSPPQELKPGAIHLVPTFFVSQLNELNPDIFISIAALSETPESFQKKIIEKKFFKAKSVFITGQLNGWGAEFTFTDHKYILDAMFDCYKYRYSAPIYHFGTMLYSYEIYGTNLIY